MWPSSENSGINNKYFTGHQWRRPKSMKQIWIKCFLSVTKSYFFSKLNIAGARNLYISWWHIQACCKEVGNFCHFMDFSNCDLEILCVGWVTHVECRVSQSNDCIVSLSSSLNSSLSCDQQWWCWISSFSLWLAKTHAAAISAYFQEILSDWGLSAY